MYLFYQKTRLFLQGLSGAPIVTTLHTAESERQATLLDQLFTTLAGRALNWLEMHGRSASTLVTGVERNQFARVCTSDIDALALRDIVFLYRDHTMPWSWWPTIWQCKCDRQHSRIICSLRVWWWLWAGRRWIPRVLGQWILEWRWASVRKYVDYRVTYNIMVAAFYDMQLSFFSFPRNHTMPWSWWPRIRQCQCDWQHSRIICSLQVWQRL